MKVALVHDWLNQMGGAEQVLLKFTELYPASPIFTSIYDRDRVDSRFQVEDVRTGFIQSLPKAFGLHRWYLPLYPLFFDRTKIDGYDAVISNSSAFCKGVRTGPNTCHICYCLTPTRFVWSPENYLLREDIPAMVRPIVKSMLSGLRRWDLVMANRVDVFVAISSAVSQRIKSCYGRECRVIFPPVETGKFYSSEQSENYFLIVSRLAPYKRIDLAVRACSRLGVRLKVAGSGRQMKELRNMAGPTVEFLGRVDDDHLKSLLSRCKALIFPGEEDFGIVPVEAQASGRPVIAFSAGGALDTVLPGTTGELFCEPEVASLEAAISKFDDSKYVPRRLQQHAQRFDEKVFAESMKALVVESVAEHHPEPIGLSENNVH